MRIALCSFLFTLVSFSGFAQPLSDTTSRLNEWYQEAQVLIEKYQFKEALKPLSNCYHYGRGNIDYLSK
ncbi:MAG: hypothetical protein AAF242_20675, partial [Bacteroidota bacterium]